MIDPFSKALSAILLPPLSKQGFAQLNPRILARVADDILQFISVHAPSGDTRWFRIEYAAISLFLPRDIIPLQPGGTLKRIEPPASLWERLIGRPKEHYVFSGGTPDAIEASMSEAVALLQSQALPFFRRTATVKGLCKILQEQSWAQEHQRHFEIGCCLARLGKLTDAEAALKHAEALQAKDHPDARQERGSKIRALLAAIANRETEELLDQWIMQSAATLGLERILGAGDELTPPNDAEE